MSKRLLALILAALSILSAFWTDSSCGESAPAIRAARNDSSRMKTIFVFGDSLSGDKYVSGFGKMYSELAEKNHAALVPYLLENVAGDPNLNLPDGIHPNIAGQKILTENVWRVLEPIAREAAAERAAHVQ